MGETSRRWVRRGLLAVVWSAGLYYLVFGGEYSWPNLRTLERERSVASVRLDSLKAAADSVEARADSLATDTFAIERTARERYGFLRKGEHLYRFVSSASGTVDPSGSGD